MGPRDPKDFAKIVAKAVLPEIGEDGLSDLRRTKADADHWLRDPEYTILLQRLEGAHAAVEAALVEARRRVRKDEE